MMRISRSLPPLYIGLIFTLLYLPITLLVINSFNTSK